MLYEVITGSEVRCRSDEIPETEVPRAKKDLRQVKGQIRVDPGVDDVLEKALVHEAGREEILGRIQESGIAGREDPQRVPCREGANGSRVHPPVRGGGHTGTVKAAG